MFGLDPLNPLTAIAEILLLLSLAALVGWFLGRLMLNGRVGRLRSSIAQKEAELEECRRSKGAGIMMTDNAVAASSYNAPAFDVESPRVEPVRPPAYVEADPLMPAFNIDNTPRPVPESPEPLVIDDRPPVVPPMPVTASGPVPGNSEGAVLSRIAARATELNFDRIGRATATEADDLKDIVGIGPFLERKLHSLGIYTYRQVANFTKEDVNKVNEIIEFFPGRIERDNWVGQARSFHERKYGASKQE